MAVTAGTLYLCATPIGNLEDLSPRAARCLQEADVVACESMERARALLSRFGIRKQLVGYRESSRDAQGAYIVKLLEEGGSVVYISDAGTPAISDPGSHLVALAASRGLKIVPIPGASALLCALSVSGFLTDSFLFLGFLPRKNRKRTEIYREISTGARTAAFFESPHRILKTLEELIPFLPGRRICLCRELTKVFEEVLRGTAPELLENLRCRKILGEFTVVIEGGEPPGGTGPEEDGEKRISALLEEGRSVREIVAILAGGSMGRKELYDRILAVKKQISEIE